MAGLCGPGASPPRHRRGRPARHADRVPTTLALVALVIVLGLPVLPRLFGYGIFTVRSASMAQTAPVGSLVVARPLAVGEVRVGDVVLVGRTDVPGALPVLHRVVSLSRRTGELVVITQGDSNAAPDPTPYLLRGTTMTPVLTVPHAGRLLTAARTPIGWTVLIALPATALLLTHLRAIWLPARRTRR